MDQLEKTLTSLEVAEMVGREHKEVLRDIRNIITQLGESKIAQSYFIESTYTNSQNREMPMFLLTKKGCELYSTRMTGEKGTQFAVAYIERFNEMENHIKQESLPINNTKLLLETALKHEERIENIESDVNMLKDTMRIDSRQESNISRNAKRAVINALGGKKSKAYGTMSRKVFGRFWAEFKRYFEVARYGDIPKKHFDEAIEWISEWQPDTTTRMEIRAENSQLSSDDYEI